MKKIKIAYLTGSFLVLLGCTDMLEQFDPTGPTGETFLLTSDELQQAVVGAYAGLSRGDSFFRQNIVGFEQFSDNVYTGSTLTDGSVATWSSFGHDAQNNGVFGGYSSLYQLINSCNLVIERAEFSDAPSDEIQQAIAEVTFLRGFAHFFLTLAWGDVAIVTETAKSPTGFAPAPSPAAEVYDQVIADLLFAETNLSPTASQRGRVTSWTAKSMLAKVYLFGADELNKPEWYGLAEAKAFDVINNGPYGLFNDLPTPEENLISIFQTFNENGKEHIFSVNHFNSGGNWSDGNTGSSFPMAMNPRLRRNRSNMWGFGWAYIFEAIDGLWDDNDARKDYNIWFQDEPVIVNGEDKGLYDQTAQNRCCAKNNGFGFQKFWYQESSKNVNGSSTLAWPVLRYAELLLVAAEADLLADGSISAAGLSAINEVRNRAGLTNLSGAVTIDQILEERRWELFGEAKRWFDFVRKRNSTPNLIDGAIEAIEAGDTDGDDVEFTSFTKERHWKLPYPQRAIDTNPNLTQKPEWGG